MTEKELKTLSIGSKVVLSRGQTIYDQHFRLGEILTVHKIDRERSRMTFTLCPRRHPECVILGHCYGDWGILENFTIVQELSDKEIESGISVSKLSSYEHLDRFFK